MNCAARDSISHLASFPAEAASVPFSPPFSSRLLCDPERRERSRKRERAVGFPSGTSPAFAGAETRHLRDSSGSILHGVVETRKKIKRGVLGSLSGADVDAVM
jgi:hypothetical protein